MHFSFFTFALCMRKWYVNMVSKVAKEIFRQMHLKVWFMYTRFHSLYGWYNVQISIGILTRRPRFYGCLHMRSYMWIPYMMYSKFIYMNLLWCTSVIIECRQGAIRWRQWQLPYRVSVWFQINIIYIEDLAEELAESWFTWIECM